MKTTIYNNKLEEWTKNNFDKHHAFLADCPYLIGFMGSSNIWDKDKGINKNIETARKWGEAIMPHLYPGAIGMMFSAPRSQHYTALGMEQAGFRVVDCMQWIFSSGFPKAQNIELMTKNKDWSGYKTASLKPAYEPILIFQAPTQGMTYAELATKYGTACFNIDGARIPIEEDVDFKTTHKMSASAGMNLIGKSGFKEGHVQSSYDEGGRYPSNIIHDGSKEVLAEFDKYGESKSGIAVQRNGGGQKIDGNGINGGSNGRVFDDLGYNDEGSVARFFYTAKVSTKEREAGLDGFIPQRVGDGREKINDTAYQRDATLRKNTHPTLKPISLIKYLATLILPPDSVKNRRIFVPFSGSGSEIIGSMLAGWDEIVGIEQEEEYCKIAKNRIAWWKNNSMNTTDVKEILSKTSKNESSGSLF